ncbi:fatty acid desaturase [Actinomycetospora callitridis]|uniref:fatty acid desaturase n=1 Tax=Actinomycetospora callitridis TaxID=913944 RepID=UPI002366C9B6|nr:fatty acid desaturase [Actinomycetospora callitridis]MDD7920369.1 fatty acid desaturase [Actinomycetospora callitridis]
MSTTTDPSDERRVLSEDESRAIRRGVPNPRVPMPAVALPTLGLFFGALALWVGATWLVLADLSPWWLVLTIPVHAVVTFLMFTVLHETAHLAGGRLRWVNEVLGRLSIVFVAAWASFPVLRFVHIEHHRNTNEDRFADPDAWSELGPSWALPLRWMTQDLYYFWFYSPLIARRPRAEVAEQIGVLVAVVAAFATMIVTGHGWELLVIYVIPQRLGIGLLAWWFDWLPHHELEATASSNRFRATRVRVGWERVMNPLMLYQNYHLVHHIHPTIPFYRYVQAWRRAESDYLDRGAPISTAWGSELSPAEYRAWRRITDNIDRDADLPRRPHRLRVAEVRRLTPDAVSITFDVPGELRETFRFLPGQNVVVGAEIDGEHVRRNYSICTAAGSGVLRIAVRLTEDGQFSTYANTRLAAGDELSVTPPGGQFTLTPDPEARRHIAAVAAGSGITPVISILASALATEPGSRATLLYANRDAGSAMFADELAMLTRQFEGRLEVVHFHSRAEGRDGGPTTTEHEDVVPARLDADRLRHHLRDPRLQSAEWFLCGPSTLLDDVESVLEDHEVPADQVHRELFVAPDDDLDEDDLADVVPATVTVTSGGEQTVVESEGTASLLETVLDGGVDVPYLCTGGICGTCRATITRGTVHMQQNYALSDDDVAGGAVLTCQSRPTSPEVAVDFDR